MASAGIGDSLEGFHAVAAAVAAGRVTDLYVEESRRYRPEVVELVADAESGGATVATVTDVRPLAATSAPQGIVARAVPLPTVNVDDLVGRATPPAVVVLDHLEDGRNVGAIARSALAARVPSMVVASRRAAPLGAAAFKAAAGSFEQVAVSVVSSIGEAMERLRDRGLWLIGLDAAADTTIWDCELWDAPVALAVGAEGRGLSRLVSERADLLVRIPTSDVESLNASVAASLALFEIRRRRGS